MQLQQLNTYLCNYTVFQIVEPPWPYIKQNGTYHKGEKLEKMTFFQSK